MFNLIKNKIFSIYSLINFFFYLFIIVRLIINNNRLIYILFWLIIIYFFTFWGKIIYIIFGDSYIRNFFYKRAFKVWFRKKILLSNQDFFFCTKINKKLFGLYFNKLNIPPVIFNEILFFTNSEKLFFSLIKDINSSIKSIYIIFYIWEPGYLSNKVAYSLIRASYRGVCCKIILDSVGSLNFFKTIWPKIMLKAGIKIVESLKFSFLNFFLRRIDLRQHKKIILIDDNITYIGSMNLVDPNFYKEYIGIEGWVDLVVKVNSFFLIYIMKIIFSYDWELETGNNIFSKKEILSFYKKSKYKKKNVKLNNLIQVITTGPGLPNNLLHRSLLNIIFSTKRRLIITTPYFIPSDFLIDAICTVADRGVDVSIIIPDKNDSFLVYWASRYLIEPLLVSNVKIYFFKGSFLHTKTILVDSNISLIGTINFDMRSIWLNLEVALIIDDVYTNRKLFKINKKYISQSKLLNFYSWQKRSNLKKILEKIIFFLRPLL